MNRFAEGDKVLYIGGEPFGTEGRPMTVSKSMESLGAYEIGDDGRSMWGMTDAVLAPDTPAERQASADRVAARIAVAVGRRDWRRARIKAIEGELEELQTEEHFLDPDPAVVAEREESSRRMLAELQEKARRR